jgi:ABC-type branched-subunit amino acid transport system substrate-binding protein
LPTSGLRTAGRVFDGCRAHAGMQIYVWVVVLCACVAAAAEDPSSLRGRRLFEAGVGSNGRPIDAVLSDSATPIPGALLSCAGCHGSDGKGRPARGVEAPDITWENLTKPYPLRVGAGRIRPAYTDALLVRAVTTGRDSSGRPLSAAMPRFRLIPADAADLIAYLRELGSRADPGIGTNVLSIGVITPSRDREPALQDAVRTALNTHAEELNRAGGIFGRRIEFSFFKTDANLDEAQSSARASMIEQAVLALVVPASVALEHDLIRRARQQPVPVIAAHADNDLSPAQHVFYLSAGITGELAALAVQAAREIAAQRSKIAVIFRNDRAGRDRTAALRPWIERAGWQAIHEISLPDSDALPIEALRQIESSDAVLIATPDLRIQAVLAHLDKATRYPLVLLPGSITAREWLPLALSPQVRILFAFERVDRSLPAEHDIAVQQPPPQELALTAARLLVEGLRRAGRKATRAKLIEAIESIKRFETSYLPPLSYGPQRHIGFTGAHIRVFDPERGQLLETVHRIQLD